MPDESLELIEIKRLEQKFDDHVTDYKDFTKDTANTISLIKEAIGNRVTWNWFWAIGVVLLGIFSTLFGVLYNGQKEIAVKLDTFQAKQQDIRSDVSYIKGTLDNSEIKK